MSDGGETKRRQRFILVENCDSLEFRLFISILIFHNSRNIVYLIAEYLKDAGLTKSHSTLIEESQLSTEFVVCDNVDLETLYLEFSSFYQVKFGKKPKFVKRIDPNVPKMPSINNPNSSESKMSLAKRRTSTKTPDQPVKNSKNVESSEYLRVSSLSHPSSDENNGNLSPVPVKPMSLISDDEFFHCQTSDWKALSETIYRDIVRRDLCVKWDDIVGLDDAKQTLQESVIFPMKYPHLFRRIQPWKGQLTEI